MNYSPAGPSGGNAATQPVAAALVVYRRGATPSRTDSIPCQFIPTQFAFTKSGNWSERPAGGANVPASNFSGGQAASITLNLLFDGRDVPALTKKLQDLTIKPSRTDDPPLVRFEWGKLTSFYANVPSVKVTYTMFKPDGTPLRAEVEVTLKEHLDPHQHPAQNPTSRGEARRTWVVTAGQTLDWIAYQEYGDAAHWRHIALTNQLADPLDLRPGQILKLGPLPAEH